MSFEIMLKFSKARKWKITLKFLKEKVEKSYKFWLNKILVLMKLW